MTFSKSNIFIKVIEEKRKNTDLSLQNNTLNILQTHRLKYSNSIIKKKDDLNNWNDAQYLLHSYLINKKNINFDDALNINYILTKNKKIIRTEAIYTAAGEHTKPQDLNYILNRLFIFIKNHKIHNIYKAFLCRYFLLSIHPFTEANGRTSQLIADYYLLQDGFLPQTFIKKSEILMASTKTNNLKISKAFKIFTTTILNSYEIIRSNH